ncbi:MAG: GerW family sporulation protein [Lachnospiraceae bacterium]|nr:GerW family sporulation protein [Lachnospiraceae bacterium]
MSEKNCSSLIESLMKGADAVFSAKTVVGEPVRIDDTIILPLVDISFGMGAGASAKDSKNGAGGGITGKVSPSAVLVIKNGTSKLVNVKNQDAVTKILDLVPDVVDKISDMITKKDMPSDKEVIEKAFPEEEV